VYGYTLWDKKEKSDTQLKIAKRGIWYHVLFVIAGLFIGSVLGYGFYNYTDAENAYLDAYTTVFSFIASYLEANKIISAWLFWIVLNGVTIYLYTQRGLDIYMGLTVIYFIASFIGYYKWKKNYVLDF
jgi:nicotinamide mononucleotide transporter